VLKSHYKQALRYFEHENHNRNMTEVLLNLASLHQAGRDMEKSSAFVERALAVNGNTGNQHSTGIALQIKGANATWQKNFKDAENHLTGALSLFEQLGSTQETETTLQELLHLYAHSGNTPKYEETRKRLEEYRNTINTRARMNIFNELSELYEHRENLRKIGEQQEALELKNRRITSLTVFLFLVSALAVIAWVLFVRIKWYRKFIYRKNLERIQAAPAISKTANSAGSEEQAGEDRLKILFGELVTVMETTKLYLDNTINLSIVARELRTNDKYLSRAINIYGQTSFVGFINTFRVNEACRLLLAGGSKVKISDIARRTGFGDLSTFYRQFKEITGLTPSQFLEMKDDQPKNTLTGDKTMVISGISNELPAGTKARQSIGKYRNAAGTGITSKKELVYES
jgi:AraC-like DNA-binding protein